MAAGLRIQSLGLTIHFLPFPDGCDVVINGKVVSKTKNHEMNFLTINVKSLSFSFPTWTDMYRE